MKGIQHSLNRHIGEAQFRQTLNEKVPTFGTNMGFKRHQGGIATYQQDKMALNYLYIKRKVLDDGYNTVSLDLWVSYFIIYGAETIILILKKFKIKN